MKKLLFTLIVSLAFGGSIFAQQPESHWPDFDYHDFEDQGALYASLMINGVPVDVNYPDWEVMEVAAFVGDELRMTAMFLTDEYVIEWGELFPTLNAEPIYYNTPGEVVTFMMYNHATGELYDVCEPVIWDGDPITILTGEEHWEGFEDPEHPLMLNFMMSETFTKDILAWTEEGNYYLISSPIGNVAAANVTNLIPATPQQNDTTWNYDFYYWDGDANDFDNDGERLVWRDLRGQSDATLEAGKGYLYANVADATLEFFGVAYHGDGTFDLDYSSISGWNLMGNPFAESATVKVGGVAVDFLVMKEDGSGFIAADRDYVEAMEGCFIQATAEGQSVTFTPDGSVVSEPEGFDKKLVINLTEGRGVADRAIVRFGVDRMMSKFQLHQNSTQVYIPMDGQDYTVISAAEMGEMPVNFKAESNGTYSLVFNAKNVSFNYLHLIDNMTGADVDLLVNPSYSFDATTSDYASRFRLVFATGSNSDDSFAFFSNGNFIISNEGEAVLQVVDVTGRILSSETINGSASVNVNAAPGVYMLRLINGNNVKVQKVVVK